MKPSARDERSTREKILQAAVKLLFASGAREVTTRKIAAEARVNIAAINYHFRSKDELVDEAVRAATASAFERGMQVLKMPGRPPAERLRDFLSGYAAGLVKFPGLTRTAWLGFFEKDGGATFYGRFMKEMLAGIAEVIEELRPPGATRVRRKSDPRPREAAVMLVSCVIFPFLASRTIRDAGALDYENDEARQRHIDIALARLT